MQIDGIDTVAFAMDSQTLKTPSVKAKHVMLFSDQETALHALVNKMIEATGGAIAVTQNDAVRFAISFTAHNACKKPFTDGYLTKVTREKKGAKKKPQRKKVDYETHDPADAPEGLLTLKPL